MTAASNVQTERVIQEVRLRPCLWNLRDNSYKNKDAKLKAWKDVCEAVCPNFGDSSGEEKKQIEKAVQLRWKTARDAYMKCRANLKTSKSGSAGGVKKKYIFFDIMTFLEDTKDFEPTHESMALTSSQTSQNVASTSSQNSQSILPITTTPNLPSTEETFQTPVLASPKPWQRKKKRCMTDFESQLLKILEKNDTSTTNFASSTALKDDDCSFFNSLAPIINDFDNYKKLLFWS
ncbi:unnamed protein product [Parnassius apollo]|uniref:(apollo) hypothetical protein n=1 Tax=Parnassius apollo TaxID=110799 RepID=A0A8S3WQ77_PARAO|nr:unnamed protein product [Parnassius apollo]